LAKVFAATAIKFASTFGFTAAKADDTRIMLVSHVQASDPFWLVLKNGAAATGHIDSVGLSRVTRSLSIKGACAYTARNPG